MPQLKKGLKEGGGLMLVTLKCARARAHFRVNLTIGQASEDIGHTVK